jgi:endonuclease YncB( thermonuclease family)
VPRPSRPGRQRLLAQLGLVAIAVVLGAGALSTALSATDTVPSAPPGSTGPGTTLPVSGGSGNVALGPTGTSEAAIVTSVIDGDTIRVQVGTQEHTVRYIGIDAPAMDDADPTTRALAAVARDRNVALVADRTVLLERDTSEADEDGRLLRYVWIETDGDRELVNLQLVRLGLARVATERPDDRYANEFRAAEAIARRAHAGVWIPSAAPTTTLIIDDRLYFIEAGTRERFTGGAGAYRWTALAIDPGPATASWTATAPTNDACAVTWTLEPTEGVEISGSIDVPHGGKETGNRVVDLTAMDAALVVSSTCERWAVAFER